MSAYYRGTNEAWYANFRQVFNSKECCSKRKFDALFYGYELCSRNFGSWLDHHQVTRSKHARKLIRKMYCLFRVMVKWDEFSKGFADDDFKVIKRYTEWTDGRTCNLETNGCYSLERIRITYIRLRGLVLINGV